MAKKILVADDSLTIQKVVELTFSESDYELMYVSDGRQALEKVLEDRPDLVLADVVMPEKNGYEVCEELKKDPATAGIPVVLLAGTFEPFDRARAERVGCAAIVSKPFDSQELVKKVEALLAPRRTADRTPVVAPSAPAPTAFAAALAPGLRDTGFAEEDFTGSIRNLRGAGRGRESLEDLYGPEDVESAIAAFREVEPSPARSDAERAVRAAPSDDLATLAIRRDVPGLASPPDEPQVAFQSEPHAVESPSLQELSESDIERLAAKVVEKLSERVVREVAWEVIPEMAELVVRERIKELESGAEKDAASPADPGTPAR